MRTLIIEKTNLETKEVEYYLSKDVKTLTDLISLGLNTKELVAGSSEFIHAFSYYKVTFAALGSFVVAYEGVA